MADSRRILIMWKRGLRLSIFVLAAVLFLLPSAAAADTGRTELNQAVIDAAGGFPYTITAPGNYLLTGSLVVPASTDGVVLEASDVVIDLNGFSITGPFTCSTGSCAAGSGSAISPGLSVSYARTSTVRNGRVRGFGDNCVQLGNQARVDDLLVVECGRDGISVAGGSLVTNNRVLQTGEHGIAMSGTAHPAAYAHNTVGQTNLGGGSFVAVFGGRPAAGNSCEDQSCSPTGQRSFYLTTTIHDGAGAGAACDTGFHLAQLMELSDPSSLYYDGGRGHEHSGASGPPTGSNGWFVGGVNDNCSYYTTTTGSGRYGGFTGALGEAHWVATTVPCGSILNVWCIAD
jgi:hypothetical protein